MFACIHGADAARLADSFSPFVETVDERTAVFSVTSRQLGRLKGLQAAVAATAEAAPAGFHPRFGARSSALRSLVILPTSRNLSHIWSSSCPHLWVWSRT